MDLIGMETNSLPNILEKEAFVNMDGHWLDEFAFNCAQSVE